MGDIATLANSVYREEATPGLPGTPRHNPVKSEIRTLFGNIDTAVEDLRYADVLEIGGNYTLANTDHRRIVVANAGVPVVACGSVTLNKFMFVLVNHTSRVVKVTGADASDILVFPTQMVQFFRYNGVWTNTKPGKFHRKNTVIYTDFNSGNDANDGLTSGAPKKTWTNAANYFAENFDASGTGPTFQELSTSVASWTSQVMTQPFDGYHAAYFQGNPSNPAACHLTAGAGHVHFQVRDNCIAIVSGFKLTNTAGGGQGFRTGHGGILDIGNIEYGTFTSGIHNFAEEGGHIGYVSGATPSITGNATYHWYAVDRANINAINVAYQIPSARAFSIFAYASDSAGVKVSGTTFAGAGYAGTTGLKFYCDGFGSVRTGGSLSLFPGSTAGSAAQKFVNVSGTPSATTTFNEGTYS